MGFEAVIPFRLPTPLGPPIGIESESVGTELGKLLLYQLSYARLMPQTLCFPIDTTTRNEHKARDTVYHVTLYRRESTSVQEHQIETEIETETKTQNAERETWQSLGCMSSHNRYRAVHTLRIPTPLANLFAHDA